MLRPFLLSSSVLLSLVSVDARALQTDPRQAPDASTTLPSGDGAQFRAKMLDWNRVAPIGTLPAEASDDLAMARPVATGRLSSTFGLRSDPIEGGVRVHAGIDIAGPMGTPVRASADGVVSFAGRAGGYGSLVRVDHGGGLQSRYGHLSRIFASPGEPVRRGDVIGLMGSTGRSTGSHLHFEVRLDGRPVDPQRSLAEGASLDIPHAMPDAAPGAPVTVHWRGLQQAEGRLPSAY
jgi:murein DD-endopeptidase MepM/ murein hydrolase activator NlpD